MAEPEVPIEENGSIPAPPEGDVHGGVGEAHPRNHRCHQAGGCQPSHLRTDATNALFRRKQNIRKRKGLNLKSLISR